MNKRLQYSLMGIGIMLFITSMVFMFVSSRMSANAQMVENRPTDGEGITTKEEITYEAEEIYEGVTNVIHLEGITEEERIVIEKPNGLVNENEMQVGLAVLATVKNFKQESESMLLKEQSWVMMRTEDYNRNRSNTLLSNGSTLMDDVILEDWFYIENGHWFTRSFHRMTTLEGTVLQESYFINGRFHTSAGEEITNESQLALSVDFGAAKYIENALNEPNIEVTGQIIQEHGQLVYVAIIQTTYESPVRIDAHPEESIIANERRYQFDYVTGVLLQAETILIGHDGYRVITSRIKPIWLKTITELPNDIKMLLGNNH